MVTISPASGPNFNSNRSADMRREDPRFVTDHSLATSMPSGRQTAAGVAHVGSNKATAGEYEMWKRSRIFNPKQASVAITSENFLKARAGLEPLYMHNIAATKLALMSVMDKEKPRYSEKVNILA